MHATAGQEDGARFNFLPLHFLAFSGDLMLATMIVGCVLSATSLGISPALVGLVGAAYGISYMVSPTLLGRASDRLGRFRSLGVSMAGYAAVTVVLLAFHREIVALVACQVAAGILYGLFWSSIEAYTSERSTGDGRDHQRRINQFCLSWSIGYMIGPFVTPVLGDIGTALPFLLLVVLATVTVAVIMLALPRDAGTSDAVKTGKARVPGAPVSPRGQAGHDEPATGTGTSRRVAVAVLVLVIFTYSFSKGFIIGTFPDIATRPDFLHWSGVQAGLALFAFGAARTVTFAVQGRVHGESLWTRVLLALALAGTCFLLVVSQDFAFACVVLGLFGVVTGLVYTMTLDKLMQITRHGKGAAAGLFESAIGLGSMVSPLAGGTVLQLAGYVAAFAMMASITLLMALVAGALLLLAGRGARRGQGHDR